MSPAPARVDELKKRYEENPRRFFAPLANEYRKAGDLDAAIDLCRMHLEEQPGHLSGHIVYGQALYESSRPADAKQAFEAALTLDPENLIALRHLGDIAKSEGDATAATHWYQRVLDADPRNDEVIALIDGLKQAPPVSTVVVSEPAAPPPPPQYAVEAEPLLEVAPAVDPGAPTPVIPIAAVEPPAMRPSLGLMDLDLNLADSTGGSVDLMEIGAVGVPPAADMPMPPAEALPPMVDEPAPAFEVGFPLADGTLAPAASEAPELLGADDTNLGLAGPSEPVEVQDTSFDIELPAADESMFSSAPAAPTFGDSLDVTVSDELLPEAQPESGPLDALPMLDVGEPVPTAAAPEPAAEPAAPTAGDFDLLFGNAPLADVQVGGDAAVGAQADAEGFIADSFVGREPSDQSLDLAPDVAAPPSPFVTETMAELYLQQGFRDEALEVYRQLLAQNPGDQGLADRVRHLEHGTRSSLALDRASEEIEAAAVADEVRRSGSIPVVPPIEEPVTTPTAIEEPVTTPTAIAEPVTAPAAIESPVSSAPSAPLPFVEQPAVAYDAFPAAPAAAPVVAAPIAAPAGPTARDVLARLASRRAMPGGGFAPSEAGVPPVPAPAEAGSAMDAPEGVTDLAAPAGTVSVAPGGALDRLFGNSGVVAVDEGAAAAMAAAFGGAAVAPIKGEPTRRGTDELSLNSVFRGDEPSAAPPVVQRQSTKLRFDQFFAGSEDGGAAGSDSGAAAPTPPPGRGEEDIAQFNTWLKGLKGS